MLPIATTDDLHQKCFVSVRLCLVGLVVVEPDDGCSRSVFPCTARGARFYFYLYSQRQPVRVRHTRSLGLLYVLAHNNLTEISTHETFFFFFDEIFIFTSSTFLCPDFFVSVWLAWLGF
jgi:hypothetical protein